jgi:hypothetical protein
VVEISDMSKFDYLRASGMRRQLIAFVAGLITWILVSSLLNRLLRIALPGYAAAELTMAFTLPMAWARLTMGAVASLGAGYVVARLASNHRRLPLLLGSVLLAIFVPVHYNLWDRFPVWYHLVFLLTILPLVVAGAKIGATKTSVAENRQ